ncbi:MAG: TonB-dependent receptor [Hyphomonadaceae bacterium]
MNKRTRWLTTAGGVIGLGLSPQAVFAQTAATEAPAETVFVLGRLEATAHDSAGEALGGDTIGASAMRTFDKTSVDQAVDLIPGASATNTGGSRNERVIFIRGFDRFQTTLSIDGVRVFLPADNRIDFGRFLTADISEVQVSKGYVSVLDGPGGLGGAVNLVTRKPSKALDAELTLRASADSDLSVNSTTVSGLLGTRQDKFYLQASGASTDTDDFTLSDNFDPSSPSLEDGGTRDHSGSEDWRVNLKAGYTPNATDEYALSYIKQSGEKNAPYHVYDTQSRRFWTWPYWDIESLYFLSRTQISDGITLRSRLYRNKFDNLLSAYDDASQTTQSIPRAFNSYYADESSGGNLTLDARLASSNTLKAALHYRLDEHKERQDGFSSPNVPESEPWQTTKEATWSIALEDSQRLADNLDLVVGASYDWTDLQQAQDYDEGYIAYPLRDMEALNAQAALSWRLTDESRLYASVSSRARFPTLFERFSSRFGLAVPNPDIDAERSLNLEIGGETTVHGLEIEGAVFHADVEDALVQIPVELGAPFGTVNQTRNAASGTNYGVELSLAKTFGDKLRIGGNYTWLKRDFDMPGDPDFRPQGAPEHKVFLYGEWRALDALTVTPSLEYASERWTVTSSSLISPARYYETGAYALLNLAADWRVSDQVSLLVGGRNLTDSDYQLVDGFPEQGRTFYLELRLRN